MYKTVNFHKTSIFILLLTDTIETKKRTVWCNKGYDYDFIGAAVVI